MLINAFESVLLQIRDTAFQMDDPPVIQAVEAVTREAHRLGLKLVLTFVTTNCRPWGSSFFKLHPEAGDFYACRAEGEIRDGRLTAGLKRRLSNATAGVGHIDRVVAAFRRTDRGLVRLYPFTAAFTVERKTWQDSGWPVDGGRLQRRCGGV